MENFYTKVVDDLESELTNLDPTVLIRSILEEQDEQHAAASAADYNTPWVMRGVNDQIIKSNQAVGQSQKSRHVKLLPGKVRMNCDRWELHYNSCAVKLSRP